MRMQQNSELSNMVPHRSHIHSVAVIYLARGKDTPWESYERFFSSYRSQPAGLEHDLVVILKGWDCDESRERFKTLCSDITATFLEFPDDGFDWGAYFRAAEALEYDMLCFLNTHSELLHPGWLRLLHDGLLSQDTGAVGCTGSWESMLPSLNYMLGYFLLGSYRVRDMLRWCIDHAYFPRYPNPHLRSNAFLIRRETMLAFARQRAIPRSKPEAYRLESGYAGLTRFLSKNGTPPKLVGVDGAFYSMREWDRSRTFRQADCGNLLVADNQTRDFAARPDEEKAIFMASTWNRERTHRVSLYPVLKARIKASLHRVRAVFR